MGIAQHDLHAFLSAQFLLIGTLHAQFADIVAGLIILVVFNIRRRHLCHVAQHVGGIGVYILPQTAALHIETRETVHLLLEDAEVRLR